jgi:DNA-binding Lrp family transcriptional regulator
MELSPSDRRLLAALEEGLPLVSRPFAALAERVGLAEEEVLARLEALRTAGVINRMGLIVRHRELGYRANAMLVLDVPDEAVSALGGRLAREPLVSLCYARPRRPPLWPYNIFCMVHGRERLETLRQVHAILMRTGLETAPRAVLFSCRRFVQRAARYARGAPQRGEVVP